MGLKKLGLLAGIAALSVSVAAVASAATSSKQASNALVFGAASDPVIIDGPLVSDGESLRVVDQIFQGLVGLKPGTTTVVPLLATGWHASTNGLHWTFNLRTGVKFSDGTPFNAKAVCFNFNRWYNFPGPLQNSAVTYYWNTVFGGFHHPAAGNPGPAKSLYRSCSALNNQTVQLNLTRRSSSFLGALALTNFGMASPAALVKYKADAGSVDSNGVPHDVTQYTASPGFQERFLGNSSKPRLSIGIGANWISPFGPLRIDLAKALLKQKGDDTKLFSFNVGTQF